MSVGDGNRLRRGSQLNPDMEPGPDAIYGCKYTARDWTVLTMTIKVFLCVVGMVISAFALWATSYQEREKMYDSSEPRGPVTKTHMGVGLGLSIVLTLLFSVGLHGVVKEKLNLINLSILLLALSIPADVALFILVILVGDVKATPFVVIFFFDLFWLTAAKEFRQQVKAKRESQQQNQNQDHCLAGSGVQMAAI